MAKHEERGRLSRRWERRPRSWVTIRLSVAAHGAARVAATPRFGQRASGCYRRLLQPVRDYWEPRVFVAAVDHLLDLVVVIVVDATGRQGLIVVDHAR